jgi:formylmethanofuran dehydrogenase subunit C/Tfp pilus assembly protein PilX
LQTDQFSFKDRISSEQGAALILAMVTVVIMTILGLVIMEVLHNSNKQVAATEASIQAELIAQKGLDEIRELIQETADNANNDVLYPGPRDKMAAASSDFANLKNLLSQNFYTKDIPALKGSYSIQVTWSDNYEALSELAATNPEYPYVQKALVTSTATMPGSGPNHVIKKQMELYVSTINPVFRYPVSAEGNLTLNGFPYIVGDVLTKGALIYSNEAKFIGKPGSDYGKSTNLPAIKGFIKVNPENGYTNRQTASTSRSWKPDYFFKAFFPFEDPSMIDYEAIDVSSYFTGHTSKMDSIVHNSSYTTITSANLIGPDLGKGTDIGQNLTTSSKVVNQWAVISGDLDMTGDLAVIGGVLTVKSKSAGDPQPNVAMQGGSIYVRCGDPDLVAADLSGTISIDSGQRIVVEGNVVLNRGFTLKGNGSMYINGNLKVLGDINIDGTIYVKGNVDLKGMGSINAGLKKTLVIAASGTFDFSNNNLNAAGQQIHAFLYSEKDMNLYGVLSKIKIYGGIHGKNVTLNAIGGVEGSLQDTVYAGDTGENFGFTPNQSSLTPDHSLLKVLYNETLYDDTLHSYDHPESSPPIRIPTTNKLDVYVKSITYGAKQ